MSVQLYTTLRSSYYYTSMYIHPPPPTQHPQQFFECVGPRHYRLKDPPASSASSTNPAANTNGGQPAALPGAPGSRVLAVSCFVSHGCVGLS